MLAQRLRLLRQLLHADASPLVPAPGALNRSPRSAAGRRGDWFGVGTGCALGLGFGVVFAFGGELADVLGGK